MKIHYCDKCGKDLVGIDVDSYEIHIYFFDKKGKRTDERTEYCHKCYLKVKKEINKIRKEV